MPGRYKKGEEGYDEEVRRYYARRNKNREDPVYRAMEDTRRRASQAKHRAEADPDNKELAKKARLAAKEAAAAKAALQKKRADSSCTPEAEKQNGKEG